jgi:hypothetical protein
MEPHLRGRRAQRDDRPEQVTWAPDTVVEADDRELGITGPFYVEDVTMRRGPETTTTLRLMKPEHVRGLRPQ